MLLPGGVFNTLPFWCSLWHLIVLLLSVPLGCLFLLLLRVVSLYGSILLLLPCMLFVFVLVLLFLLLRLLLRSILILSLRLLSVFLVFALVRTPLSMLGGRLTFVVPGLLGLVLLLLGTILLVDVLLALCVGCSRDSESQRENCCADESDYFQGVPPMLLISSLDL